MRHLVPSCQVEFLQLLIIGALSPAAQPSQAILGRRDLSGPFGERKFCTFQNTRSSLSGRLIWAREWVGLLGHLVASCQVELLHILPLGAQSPAAQPSQAILVRCDLSVTEIPYIPKHSILFIRRPVVNFFHAVTTTDCGCTAGV